MVFTHEVTVAWGDCDEAGIVFYPGYFYWFDSAFQALLRARGLSQRTLRERWGILGTPLVGAAAEFRAPVTYDDVLRIEVVVARWGRRSFRVGYRGRRGEALALEGHEDRVWGIRGPEGGLATAEIPEEFRTVLDAG